MLGAGLAEVGLVVVHGWEGWGVLVVLTVFQWGCGPECLLLLLFFRVME